MMNPPLRSVPQICVKPRKLKVSGLNHRKAAYNTLMTAPDNCRASTAVGVCLLPLSK